MANSEDPNASSPAEQPPKHYGITKPIFLSVPFRPCSTKRRTEPKVLFRPVRTKHPFCPVPSRPVPSRPVPSRPVPSRPRTKRTLNERVTNQGFMTFPPQPSMKHAELNASRAPSRPYYLLNSNTSAQKSGGAIASPTKSLVSKVMDLMFGV